MTVSKEIRQMSGASFAAEIVGFSFPKDDSCFDCAPLRSLLRDNAVLVFRDQELTAGGLVRIGQIFGDIESPWSSHGLHTDDSRVQVIVTTGKVVRRSSQHWHVDQSFLRCPSKETLLWGRVIPKAGGETMFADMVRAYEGLPARVKSIIKTLRARHSFSYRMAARETAKNSGASLREGCTTFPDVYHPLVCVDRDTGSYFLFLSELCSIDILGWERDRSRELLEELLHYATQERFRYTHNWRAGDLVVWDNRRLLHRGTRVPVGMERLHYCVNTCGDFPRGIDEP